MPVFIYLFYNIPLSEGVGNKGDILTLRPSEAYREYLMPGLAVYASPKNLEIYKVDETKAIVEAEFSSPYVQRVSKSAIKGATAIFVFTVLEN